MTPEEIALAAEVSRLLSPRRPGWAARLEPRGLLLCSVAFYPAQVAVLCNTTLASFFAPLDTAPETLAFQLNVRIGWALGEEPPVDLPAQGRISAEDSAPDESPRPRIARQEATS